ncbi:preprotein translocase, SecE subunit [Desulfotomaculum nigrificans CO-1-SRB]|uniref:Protein translocase subunit SecE n=1 Tax=Desulfotomaculum nigrificans (strain DSM 14880 / VKM B-2319 / CO-1-SRB) TaxID=868595 RepID=F6B583_DESCC|nr:preprotein translocase subunit SecE [Desulfotomaculum nigrificans]AEF93102.1 preprotein translocase, SecE subunit [Desulfotomaculum nigrificans CO-1-SRB]
MAVQRKQIKKVGAAKEIAATRDTSGAENKKDAAPKDAAKAQVKKESPKVPKASFSDRAGSVRRYLRGVQNELKKVHWPTRKEVVTYTAVVLVSVAAVAAVIWVLDSLLSLGVSAIVS